MHKHYDLVVIGTGAANIVVDAAVRQGLHIAIVEKGKFGGTCLNRGCIPTKILVTAANYVREIKEAERLGVVSGPASINWQTVSDRLWGFLNPASQGTRDYYASMENIDIYEGTASFTDKKDLHINLNDGSQADISGDKIILGTGAKTNIPVLPGLEEAGYVTSESLFGDKYPQKPYKSLIIVGGGPIGCEFGHVFNAAGTKVTIVQHNVRLLPKDDEDVSAFLLTQFINYGIDVELNKDTVSVEIKDGLKVLRFKDRSTGEEGSVAAEEILIAPGVKPTTDLLHLENTDVTLDKRGYIETNEFLETAAEGIWALGDINGLAPFRHKANYEAEIISHNLFENREPKDWRWARYDLVPAVTYTYPEAAQVGLTEANAKKAGYDVDIAVNHYSTAAKGYALGFEQGNPNDGFVKLVIDKKTKHLLGAHIIGHEASILIQPFINLMNAGPQPFVIRHEEIASPTVKKLRESGLTRDLVPQSIYTIGETMTPHPSLQEITMWTRYYYEHK